MTTTSDRPYTTTEAVCHGCSDFGRCEETFRCTVCKTRYNSCHYRIGGLDGCKRWPSVCTACWEESELGWDRQQRRAVEQRKAHI